MKIAYASDLHFEFAPLDLGEIESGDVIILAGDILNVNHFITQLRIGRIDQTHIIDFFNTITSKFKHVFMVMGNHEYYNSQIDETIQRLVNALPKYDNFTILDGDSVVVNNTLFVGGTLWTNYNNGDIETLVNARRMIADYRAIYNGLYTITASDIYERHKHFVLWVERIDKMGYDNVILITHHSPSMQTTADEYIGDDVMNGLFGSNLDYLLKHFDYAVFGHQHNPKTPEVNGCKLLNNSRGYPHEPSFKTFNLKYINI